MSYYFERRLREASAQLRKQKDKNIQRIDVVPLSLALELFQELSSHSIIWDAYEFE